MSQGLWDEAMVWGCKVVVIIPNPKLKTLGERGIERIFVGYAEHSKAFRFYVIEPNKSVSIKSIIKSRNAIFDENRFSLVSRPSQRSLITRTKDIGGSVVPEMVTEDVLADLPAGCKPLGYKWIFKRKLKVDGTIEKFKARLVIQCFRQKSKIDYFDTYALMVRISTIRLLIAMASIHNLIIYQMDVKLTFLNEFLSSRFSMKDTGEADVILVSTHMDTSEKLMPKNGQVVSQLECYRVIGYLMYVMTCTLPDIAFVVGKLTSNTKKNSSTSDWVFLLGGGAISWASKKQTCITSSTMESEFVALAVAGKEAEWLKNFLLEILLWSKPIVPIFIHCDSAATLAKAYS
nr:hypothetical protein [Tanacetum cinerariifolium]